MAAGTAKGPLTSVAVIILFACGVIAAGPSQPSVPVREAAVLQDSSRGLWETRFELARPTAKTKKKKLRKSSEPETPETRELIGLTVWRLQRATESSDSEGARLEDKKKDSPPTQLAAERVLPDTQLREGDLVRIGIEVPRAGYLYAIDRESYSDGTVGHPYLIFPTAKMHGGGHLAAPGRIIEIPAQTDNPPYFTLQRSRNDQVSERLTIIVSEHRLKLAMGGDRVPLDPAQVDGWEREWGARAEHWETRRSTFKGWTLAEKQAARGERRLVQGDPLPQTIYRVAARRGAPLLVTVSLKIAL